MKQWNKVYTVGKYRLSRFKNVVRTLPVFLFLSLIGSSLSFGQDLFIKETFTSVDSLFKLKEFDQAFTKCQVVSSKTIEVGDWQSWYKAFTKKRKIIEIQRKFEEGLSIFEKDLLIIPDSLPFYKTMINYHIGRLYFKQNKFHTAIPKMESALEQLIGISAIDSTRDLRKIISAAFVNLSLYYSRIGDQNSAINFSREGLKQTNIEYDARSSCRLMINLGKYLFHSKNVEAAIPVYKEVIASCTYYEPYAILYLAESYTDIDSLSEAQSTLALYAKKYLATSKEGVNDYYRILGDVSKKQGDINAAIDNQTLALSQHEVFTTNRTLIQDLLRLAKLHLEVDGLRVADSLSNIALGLYKVSKEEIIEEDEILDLWHIEALNVKAKVSKAKYAFSNLQIDLDTMNLFYNQIFTQLIKIKSANHSMTSKYRIGEFSQSIYTDLLNFYFDKVKKIDNSNNFNEAFQLVQLANSFVLKEEMSLRQKLISAKIPQDSINSFLDIRARFLSSENSVEDFEKYNSYKQKILGSYPYITNYFPKQEIQVAEVKEQLLDEDLLVKYHYFENQLYVFLLSKSEEVMRKIEFGELEKKLLTSYQKEVSTVDLKGGISKVEKLTQISKEVHQLILGQFLSKLKGDYTHLILVPDGPIRGLTFSALNIQKENNNVDDASNYLLSKYATSYLYFISQLKSSDSPLNGGAVSFGIEYSDEYLNKILSNYNAPYNENDKHQQTRGVSLGSLAFADDEARSVAKILGGEFVVNEKATQSSLKQALQSGKLVHMSLHALLNPNDYLESILLLSESDTKETSLSYRDILNLDLKNDLVVLSACETNLGKKVEGEGLLSISRALVQSGCKASLGANWSVPDNTTKQIMTLFYENLKLGMTKSKALQQAQIKYLSDDEISTPMLRSPYFWSAWALYGLDTPVYRHFTINYSLLLLLIVFVFISLFIFIKNMRLKDVTKH